MATKVKTQVPVTPTPATPAKNALPTPKPFTESVPVLETDTESETVQMSAMSATPPNEEGTGKGDRLHPFIIPVLVSFISAGLVWAIFQRKTWCSAIKWIGRMVRGRSG